MKNGMMSRANKYMHSCLNEQLLLNIIDNPYHFKRVLKMMQQQAAGSSSKQFDKTMNNNSKQLKQLTSLVGTSNNKQASSAAAKRASMANPQYLLTLKTGAANTTLAGGATTAAGGFGNTLTVTNNGGNGGGPPGAGTIGILLSQFANYPNNQSASSFTSFFDPLIRKSFDLQKLTPELLKKWESQKDTPDACSLMLVSTSVPSQLHPQPQNNNAPPLAHQLSAASNKNGQQSNPHHRNASPIQVTQQFTNVMAVSDNGASTSAAALLEKGIIENAFGKQHRLYLCALCQEHLFLFEVNQLPAGTTMFNSQSHLHINRSTTNIKTKFNIRKTTTSSASGVRVGGLKQDRSTTRVHWAGGEGAGGDPRGTFPEEENVMRSGSKRNHNTRGTVGNLAIIDEEEKMDSRRNNPNATIDEGFGNDIFVDASGIARVVSGAASQFCGDSLVPEGFCVSTVPDYYLNIEFALLSVLKNASGTKCGFNLTFKDRSHDFVVVTLDSIDTSNNYNFASTMGYGGAGYSGQNVPGGPSTANIGGVTVSGFMGQTLGGNNTLGNTLGATLGPNLGATLGQTKSFLGEGQSNIRLGEFNSTIGGGLLLGATSGQEGGNKQYLNPHGTRYSKAQWSDIQNNQEVVWDIRYTFKKWMVCLNDWVIRSQNLKKFNVVAQIGVGGQARVYKIVDKKTVPLTPNNLNNTQVAQANPFQSHIGLSNNTHVLNPSASNFDGGPVGVGQGDILPSNQSADFLTPAFHSNNNVTQAVCNSGSGALRDASSSLLQAAATMNHNHQNSLLPQLSLPSPKNTNNGGNLQPMRQQSFVQVSNVHAMKIFNKKKYDTMDRIERIQMMDEIRVMRDLKNCANTLKLFKIYENDKYINLMLEYHEGGTLAERLEKQIKFNEDEARLIIAQLLLTVDFMCLRGVIHRDLKPENLLLNSKKDYDVRIADFGYVTMLDTASPIETSIDKSVCGTAGYIAPEAFDGRGYTTKSDVFSVGSIMYSVLTLRNLFKGNDYKHTLDLNKHCNVPDLSLMMKSKSSEAKDLLGQLLKKDPNQRPSAKQALQHPWFKQDQPALLSSLQANNVLAKNSSVQHFMHSGSFAHGNSQLHKNPSMLLNPVSFHNSTPFNIERSHGNCDSQHLNIIHGGPGQEHFRGSSPVRGTRFGGVISAGKSRNSSLNSSAKNNNRRCSVKQEFRLQNKLSIHTNQLQNQNSMNPGVQGQTAATHQLGGNFNTQNLHVGFGGGGPGLTIGQATATLQNQHSVASKRSDSLSSHHSGFRAQRNQSMDGGGFIATLSQRSEILQQFNYHKIVKEYRQSQSRNGQSASPGPSSILRASQFQRFLEIPTGKVAGRTTNQTSSFGIAAAQAAVIVHNSSGQQPNFNTLMVHNQSFNNATLEQQQQQNMYNFSYSNMQVASPPNIIKVNGAGGNATTPVLMDAGTINQIRTAKEGEGGGGGGQSLLDSRQHHLEIFAISKSNQNLNNNEEQEEEEKEVTAGAEGPSQQSDSQAYALTRQKPIHANKGAKRNSHQMGTNEIVTLNTGGEITVQLKHGISGGVAKGKKGKMRRRSQAPKLLKAGLGIGGQQTPNNNGNSLAPNNNFGAAVRMNNGAVSSRSWTP